MWALHVNSSPFRYTDECGLVLVSIFYEYKDAVKALASVIDESPDARIDFVEVTFKKESEK